MLRLWFTRRWLVATLLAVLFGGACYALGSWQWSRYRDKQVKVTAIETNYGAAPVALGSALSGPGLTPERQWTHVSARGTYAVDAELLVRNRTLGKVVGFEVLTPLVTDAGTVLVDRGWVPNASTAIASPPVDAPPSGPVEITGWLRTGEPSLGRDLPTDQLASISVTDARRKGAPIGGANAYIVLGDQSPPSTPGGHPVTLLPRPEEDLGPHQAYAIQWWLTMPGGLAFVVWALRREVSAGAADSDGPPEEVRVRPKKVRIWDEEDY